MKYSITTMLLVTLLAAIAVTAWKRSQPLEHFEIVVSGHVATKFEPGTRMAIWSNNQSESKPVVCDLKDLPLKLKNEEYRGRQWYVSFLGPHQSQELFSVVLSAALFDTPRRIDIRLDEPKPALRPILFDWRHLKYSANISQRMAYHDLPFWNKDLGRLTPCPNGPRLAVTNNNTAEERRDAEMTTGCWGSRWYYIVSNALPIDDGDRLVFSAEYDSGGLFDDTAAKFIFDYQSSLHGRPR